MEPQDALIESILRERAQTDADPLQELSPDQIALLTNVGHAH